MIPLHVNFVMLKNWKHEKQCVNSGFIKAIQNEEKRSRCVFGSEDVNNESLKMNKVDGVVEEALIVCYYCILNDIIYKKLKQHIRIIWEFCNSFLIPINCKRFQIVTWIKKRNLYQQDNRFGAQTNLEILSSLTK